MIQELESYVNRWTVVPVGIAVLCADGLATAFYIWCFSGLVSVGIDLDHLPAVLFRMFPALFPQFEGIGGRWLHRLAYNVAGGLVVLVGALALGLTLIAIRQTYPGD